MARDDSAFRYGVSFCGSTICLFMAFSILQIQWTLPSFRFRASAANSAGDLLHPGLGAPRRMSLILILGFLLFWQDGTLFSFCSPHNHCWEHCADDLFAHSFRIETHAWGPPVADRETAAISVRMVILDYAGICLLHGIQAVTNPTQRRRGTFLKLSC